MARFPKFVVSMSLAGMFASASAGATVFDLGALTPGTGSFRLIGAAATPGVQVDDQYAFDVVGSDGKIAGSVVTSQVSPNGTDGLFNITIQLFEWDPGSSSFIAITGLNVPSPAVVLPADLDVFQAQGGDPNGIDRAYYLEVKSAPGEPAVGIPGKVAGYGGSINIAAVPEPSSLLFLLGGAIFAAFFGRRRLVAA